MGRLRDWLLGTGDDDPYRAVPSGPQFDSIGSESIPASFFGLTSYTDDVAPMSRVSRRSAMQVPACKRARDLVAGTLGSLPLDLYGPDGTKSPMTLLAQPEAGMPASVTWTRVFEDMFLEGVSWLLVTQRNWAGFPSQVVRLDPSTVTVRQDGKVYRTKMGNSGMTWEYAPDFDIIRFDSPNDGLLLAGARAIRSALALDAASLRYANGNQPLDYFTPVEGADPIQANVDAALDAWEMAREQRATGYVPAALKYNTAAWDPEKLQLADQRQHAVLEIARLAGVDPEDLGVSTTSRTYQNATDRYSQRIKDTLRGYAVAFEQRLSMGDCTPRGYRVQVNFSDLLRADDKTRFEAYGLGLTVGAYADKNEIREAEGKPALPVAQAAYTPPTAPAAAPTVPAEVTTP